MAFIKFLRYAAADDYDMSANKENKPPVPLSGAKGLPPLVRGKTFRDDFEWLGNDEKQVVILRLGLTDGSVIFINRGSDGSPEVIYAPPPKTK